MRDDEGEDEEENTEGMLDMLKKVIADEGGGNEYDDDDDEQDPIFRSGFAAGSAQRAVAALDTTPTRELFRDVDSEAAEELREAEYREDGGEVDEELEAEEDEMEEEVFEELVEEEQRNLGMAGLDVFQGAPGAGGETPRAFGETGGLQGLDGAANDVDADEAIDEEQLLSELAELEFSEELWDGEEGEEGEGEGEEGEDEFGERAYSMTLGELLRIADVEPIAYEGDLDVEVTGIQQDSREVQPGDLFVCCEGLKTDGHMYANEALERGAIAIFSSKEVEIYEPVRALVLLEDTSAALSALADAFYGHPSQSLTVVGITGTNGKTTTSYLRCDACIMEVSSHALALGRCTRVEFDVAVFTNLTRDHMDFHATPEEYRDAKAQLFQRMVDPARHRKVVNLDDPAADFFVDQGHPDVPTVTYGLEREDADVYPLEVSLSLFETELVVRTPKISSGLLGRHNVSNILAAIAVGIAVGADLEDIQKGIEEVDAVPGRCELIDEEQAFAVIVDYAHTPDALGRLLDTVRECGPTRIITVVGCGGERDRGKRPIMGKIATDKSDITILTSDNPRNEDASGLSCSLLLLPLPVASAAVSFHPSVVAGKGHETYQIDVKGKRYFDDREECREALQNVAEIRQHFDTSEIPWRLFDESQMRPW
eukprot:jgi/Mesen1/5800/ME000293S04951